MNNIPTPEWTKLFQNLKVKLILTEGGWLLDGSPFEYSTIPGIEIWKLFNRTSIVICCHCIHIKRAFMLLYPSWMYFFPEISAIIWIVHDIYTNICMFILCVWIKFLPFLHFSYNNEVPQQPMGLPGATAAQPTTNLVSITKLKAIV